MIVCRYGSDPVTSRPHDEDAPPAPPVLPASDNRRDDGAVPGPTNLEDVPLVLVVDDTPAPVLEQLDETKRHVDAITLKTRDARGLGLKHPGSQ